MSDENNSSDWIEDGAEYSPKSEFSKPKVVEDATRKCFELRAKEMRRGYYNTRYSKEGLPLKVWIEDSRKAYCSSVIALRHLLMPEILTDTANGKKEKEDKEKGTNKKLIYKHIKLGKIKMQYSYFILKKVIENEKVKFVKTGEYYIPDLDEGVYIRKIFPDGNEELVRVEGYWNSKVNAYWDHMVRKCDLLFEELMKVIHRLNYFKQSIRFG